MKLIASRQLDIYDVLLGYNIEPFDQADLKDVIECALNSCACRPLLSRIRLVHERANDYDGWSIFYSKNLEKPEQHLYCGKLTQAVLRRKLPAWLVRMLDEVNKSQNTLDMSDMTEYRS